MLVWWFRSNGELDQGCEQEVKCVSYGHTTIRLFMPQSRQQTQETLLSYATILPCRHLLVHALHGPFSAWFMRVGNFERYLCQHLCRPKLRTDRTAVTPPATGHKSPELRAGATLYLSSGELEAVTLRTLNKRMV